MKAYEKKEYEPKKLGSILWWNMAAWLLLFGIVLEIIIPIAMYGVTFLNATSIRTEMLAGNYTVAEALDKNSQFSIVLTWVSVFATLIASILIIVLALNIAMKKVRKRAIIKQEMVPEIMWKFKFNTFILLALSITLCVAADFILESKIVMGTLTIISYIIHSFVEIAYAKKLVSKDVVVEEQVVEYN